MKAVIDQPPAILREDSSRSCINCREVVNSRYCSNCGQKNRVDKITWKSLLQEFTARWLGFDNQFARTFIDVTIRPRHLVKSYLGGNRVAYLGPLGYYIIVTAIIFLVMSLLNISIEDIMQASSQVFTKPDEMSEKQLQFQENIFHYLSVAFRFMAIAFVPFFAWTAMLLYRKKGFNFLEHSIIIIYATAHTFWLTLLQGVILKVSDVIISFALTIAHTLFYGYYYMSIMGERKSVKSFLKGILVYLLGLLFFLLFFFVALFLFVQFFQ